MVASLSGRHLVRTPTDGRRLTGAKARRELVAARGVVYARTVDPSLHSKLSPVAIGHIALMR